MPADRGDLLIIGASGHAKVLIDVARAVGWNCVAAFGKSPDGAPCNGVDVADDDSQLPSFFERGVRHAAIGIGDNRVRLRLAGELRALGFGLPALVHPAACVSPSARIGEGTLVMPLSIINADARVGDAAIVNSGAIVEHDCVIGDGAHVAPNSVLGGGVMVGKGAFVGIGATVRPQGRIGDFAQLGAGAVAVHDIADSVLAVGVPARGVER